MTILECPRCTYREQQLDGKEQRHYLERDDELRDRPQLLLKDFHRMLQYLYPYHQKKQKKDMDQLWMLPCIALHYCIGIKHVLLFSNEYTSINKTRLNFIRKLNIFKKKYAYLVAAFESPSASWLRCANLTQAYARSDLQPVGPSGSNVVTKIRIINLIMKICKTSQSTPSASVNDYLNVKKKIKINLTVSKLITTYTSGISPNII